MNHCGLLLSVLLAAAVYVSSPSLHAEDTRFFELRTYTAAPGKLTALHERFRSHTNALFTKHGMTMVGYWTLADGEKKDNTLVYILSYPSREAREKSWKEFQADPEWQKAKAASEADGKLVDHVESVYLNPTDYSPLK